MVTEMSLALCATADELFPMDCRQAIKGWFHNVPAAGNEAHANPAHDSTLTPFTQCCLTGAEGGADGPQDTDAGDHLSLRVTNPVELEQREGRVHRDKGRAIRHSLCGGASLLKLRCGLRSCRDLYRALFAQAEEMRRRGQNDLIPYCVFEVEGGDKVIRQVPAVPLSREHVRLDELRRMLAAYHLVFGQLRHEDLLRYLEERLGREVDAEELAGYQIDLSPR